MSGNQTQQSTMDKDDSSSELSDPPSSSSPSPSPDNITENIKEPVTPRVTRRSERLARKERGSMSSEGPPLSPYSLLSFIICPTQDERCENKKNHELGEFCPLCRAIKMPWGDQLPYVYDIDVGPKGSVLEDVFLQGKTSVAVVAAVTMLRVNDQPDESIPHFPLLLGQYPESIKAGERIAELFQRFSLSVTYEEEVQKWYSVVQMVLEHPKLSVEDHLHLAHKHLQEGGTLVDRPPSYVDATTQATLTMSYKRLHPNERDLDQEALEAAVASIKQLPTATTAFKELDPEDGDDELSQEEKIEEEDLLFKTRKGNRKSGGPVGVWELYPGQDTTPAALSQPDPSKFVMLRQDANDPSKLDLRQYLQVGTFDWDNQQDIKHLNQTRERWVRQMNDSVKTKEPWTEAETAVLKSLVQREMAILGTGSSLDWQKVALNLNKHFTNITQKKGDALAQDSELSANKKVIQRQEVQTLEEDRIGGVGRTQFCCRQQANKYADIKKLFITSRSGKRTRTSKKDGKAKSETVADSNEGFDVADNESEDGDNEYSGVRTPKRARLDAVAGSSTTRRQLRPRSGGAGHTGTADGSSSVSTRSKTILPFR